MSQTTVSSGGVLQTTEVLWGKSVNEATDSPESLERFTIELEVLPRPVAPTSHLGFADFYRTEFDGAVRVARFLTGSWDAGRDVTQDAFCGLHRNWHRVEQPEAYLRRSLVNGAASLHRRRGRDRARPVPRAEVSELDAHHLTDVLAALPERQRAAVVLRFHADLPDAAIAEALGVKVGSVASLVHRALATLRIALGEPEDITSTISPIHPPLPESSPPPERGAPS